MGTPGEDLVDQTTGPTSLGKTLPCHLSLYKVDVTALFKSLHYIHSKANQQSQIKTKMNFLAITLLATGSSALSLTKDLKAASPFVNLGCQCGSLTFVDSHGQVLAPPPHCLPLSLLSSFFSVSLCSPALIFIPNFQVQGNCRSVDSTGARWCYIDHLPSSCQVTINWKTNIILPLLNI